MRATRGGGAAGAMVLLLAVAAGPAQAQEEALGLAVQDAIAPPGGVAAVVVGTYASRPVGQGQVCLRVSGRAFSSAEGAVVVARPDQVFSRAQAVDPRTAMIQFLSPRAAVNRRAGPMIVLYLRVADTASPGQAFDIEIDMLNTFLRDAAGQLIPLDPRPGRLRIRAPGDPISLSAEGDRIVPGATAELGVQSFEPLRLSSGQVTFLYDPAVAGGPAEVGVAPVFGQATLAVDDSLPGRLIIAFTSPDGSLNRVPGTFLSIRLPTSPSVPAGTQSPLELDPLETFVLDRDGHPVPLVLEGGTLDFE